MTDEGTGLEDQSGIAQETFLDQEAIKDKFSSVDAHLEQYMKALNIDWENVPREGHGPDSFKQIQYVARITEDNRTSFIYFGLMHTLLGNTGMDEDKYYFARYQEDPNNRGHAVKEPFIISSFNKSDDG